MRDTLKREVNPVVMTMDEFSKLARNGDRFANRVLIEPKLFIKANADDIAELVEDRSAGET